MGALAGAVKMNLGRAGPVLGRTGRGRTCARLFCVLAIAGVMLLVPVATFAGFTTTAGDIDTTCLGLPALLALPMLLMRCAMQWDEGCVKAVNLLQGLGQATNLIIHVITERRE